MSLGGRTAPRGIDPLQQHDQNQNCSAVPSLSNTSAFFDTVAPHPEIQSAVCAVCGGGGAVLSPTAEPGLGKNLNPSYSIANILIPHVRSGTSWHLHSSRLHLGWAKKGLQQAQKWRRNRLQKNPRKARRLCLLLL